MVYAPDVKSLRNPLPQDATAFLQDGIMLASRTNWFRAISTFILLYLLSAGSVALILWRLPAKSSLQQPRGRYQALPSSVALTNMNVLLHMPLIQLDH